MTFSKPSDDTTRQAALESYRTVFQDALIEVLKEDPVLVAQLTTDVTSDHVQRLIARGKSEIHDVKMKASDANKTHQEVLAEDESYITGSELVVEGAKPST